MLLRFHAPEYSMTAERGIVRWRIRDGLLVARKGRGDGYLEIDVRRGPADEPGRATLHVEVEVASFYPAIATWVARWFYANTQSRIHVLVTHGFLRSLAKLELEESAVGRFAVPESGARAGAAGGGPQDSADVTVGDTPWPLVGALGGAARRSRSRCWRAGSAGGVAGERAQLAAVVARLDPAHGARARAHHERLRAGPARALVAHALRARRRP